ncbi:MAG TPA: CYCXC family (seleno)protein [Terriglobales bacterium]|nr:CYCXC family (seleno)protein [Terriglobales bacterium]
MRVPALALASILALGVAASAQQAAHAKVPAKTQATEDAPVVHDGDSPAYHTQLPLKGSLPPTLDPKQFQDPRVQAAYAMAAKVRPVLYQQPCYCHCDKEVGHHSLLDCFAGDHASICETCLMEGVYAYRQTEAGKSAGAIRAAIKRGDWKTVNLNDLLLGSRVY